MPRTIIEVASINQLKRERDPLAGRKELIKEQVQLKEGAAVRFSIWDRQRCAAALHALSVLGALHKLHSCVRHRDSLFSWEHCYSSS